jgi:hypothetical protein
VPQSADVVQSSECRQCCAFCDRVLLPSGCIESRCPYLYLYDDERSGRRFMGCLNKVFKVEIDVELFREAERSRPGFGTVRLANAPLRRCRYTVEQAYDGRGLEAYRCVNKRFYDWPDEAPDAIRAFDLRDRCAE